MPVAEPPQKGAVEHRHRLAIAEDDDEIRTVLAEFLAHDGFEITWVSDGAQLVDYLEKCRLGQRLPDLVILDHGMPGYCGLDILEGVKTLGLEVPLILITAYGQEVARQARHLGAWAVFDKPFDLDDLRTAVRFCLDAVGTGAMRAPTFSHLVTFRAPSCSICSSHEEVRLMESGRYICSACQPEP